MDRRIERVYELEEGHGAVYATFTDAAILQIAPKTCGRAGSRFNTYIPARSKPVSAFRRHEISQRPQCVDFLATSCRNVLLQE